MSGAPLPPFAAWRHTGARAGFEVVFPRAERDGSRSFQGHTVALEDGEAWVVRYAIAAGPSWKTRSAHIVAESASGRREVRIESDGAGTWLVDDAPAPALDGCLDVDLESSVCTNALPVHRLALGVGDRADAPAAYVRVRDLVVERLEQRYVRTAAERYAYAAPRFGYSGDLVYDAAGLVLDYPGLAERAA